MADSVVELVHQKGAQDHFVRLTLQEGGALMIDAQDLGPGDYEYEYSVTVPANAVPQLAFELLRDKFAGQVRAVEALRDWCKARGIAHEFFTWR